MSVPQGVTEGRGKINCVNCIILPQFMSHCVWYHKDAYIPTQPMHHVIRYTDFGGSIQYYSVPTGPRNTYFSDDYATIDSVYYRSDAATFYYRTPSLNLVSDLKGTNAASYGTSQYPVGYAPVPTSGKIIRVGPTRTYTDVWSAYLAASHGTDIIIDPGTYDIDASNGTELIHAPLVKCVRFWGATEDPTDVILRGVSYPGGGNARYFFLWYPYYMGNVPDGSFGCGIFHLTIDASANPDYWDTIQFVSNVAGTDSNPWNPSVSEDVPVTGVSATGSVGLLSPTSVKITYRKLDCTS
jgi:hypothetical protein